MYVIKDIYNIYLVWSETPNSAVEASILVYVVYVDTNYLNLKFFGLSICSY